MDNREYEDNDEISENIDDEEESIEENLDEDELSPEEIKELLQEEEEKQLWPEMWENSPEEMERIRKKEDPYRKHSLPTKSIKYIGVEPKISGSVQNIISELKNLNIQGIERFCLIEIKDRLIFLTGEDHTILPKPCKGTLSSMNLVNFFSLFFENSPICCDFFLEQNVFLPLGSEGNKMYEKLYGNLEKESNIDFLLSKYINCFQTYNKEKCREFGNVRMHNIEYRRQKAYSGDKTENVYLSLEKDVLTKRTRYPSEYQLIEGYKDILVFLLNNRVLSAIRRLYDLYGINVPVSSEEVYLTNTRYSKLSKQLYQLPENVKDDLIGFYDLFSGIYASREEKSDLSATLPVLIMDCYAIARILKTIYIYQDSGLLFVHAGSFHINHYIWFLTKKAPGTVIIDINNEKIGNVVDPTCVSFTREHQKVLVDTLEKFYRTHKETMCSLKESEPPF